MNISGGMFLEDLLTIPKTVFYIEGLISPNFYKVISLQKDKVLDRYCVLKIDKDNLHNYKILDEVDIMTMKLREILFYGEKMHIPLIIEKKWLKDLTASFETYIYIKNHVQSTQYEVIKVVDGTVYDIQYAFIDNDVLSNYKVLDDDTVLSLRLNHHVPIKFPLETENSTKKGKRYNSGKLQIHEVPTSLIYAVAQVLSYGAQKYDKHNWRKGMEFSTVYDCLQRHITSWWDGEEFDEESGLPHLYHVAANVAILIEYSKTQTKYDDRYTGEKFSKKDVKKFNKYEKPKNDIGSAGC